MQYSKETLHYFHHLAHAITDADASLDGFYQERAGVIEQGEQLQLYIKIEQDNIKSIQYRISGGVALMSCTEYVACQLESRSVHHALTFSPYDILKALKLPKTRIPAAQLPLLAIRKAIKIRAFAL